MFILTRCIDRELDVQTFETKEDAWKAMRDDMLDFEDEATEAYDDEKDEAGFVEDADCYGINEDSAWLNGDDGDMECDWKIFEA